MYKYTEYLPPYLPQIRDIREAGEAIDPKVQAVYSHMEQMARNQHISTCDEEALRRRERLFEIYADPAAEDQYSAWVSCGDWNYRLGSWSLGSAPFQEALCPAHRGGDRQHSVVQRGPCAGE